MNLANSYTLASVLAIQSRYPEIPASALELEVTERDSGIEASAFRAIVDRFHACGLRLGLDDFGSQYANLSLFTNVKFDTIKMDRSLIADVVHNPIAQTLVQDIVQICRTHHMACVAEGVENRAQLDVLLKMGCPYAQGYYYDRPLPAQAFAEKYLRGGTPSERRETRKEDCIGVILARRRGRARSTPPWSSASAPPRAAWRRCSSFSAVCRPTAG